MRKYKHLDLLRLHKQGYVDKDVKGFFLNEEPQFFYKLYRTRKFYINEEFDKMEEALQQLGSHSIKMKDTLQTKLHIDSIGFANDLLQIDFTFLLIQHYYQGKTNLPLISYRQLLAWILHEKKKKKMLNEIKKNRPTMIDSLKTIQQLLTTEEFFKWVISHQ
ncbi:hypothetical protein [Bacillus suaedae]|uniref:Uncharacterized protein n=1 Tax=Halalkalibacter suaedae TaxID=2822140 RepID=A0A940WXD9_9BACI|nr:hypothetical protein [Bacillus suaedae]MBP3952412.1 hypothetical protein [Bacillus suaedae]